MASGLIVLVAVVVLTFNCRQVSTADDVLSLTNQLAYSHLIRPDVTGAPINVFVYIHISHLEFKPHKMDAVFFLKTIWTDSRLLYNESIVTSLRIKGKDGLQKIWTPDLHFPNSMAPVQIMNDGYIEISPDTGKVTYSQMLRGTFPCHYAIATWWPQTVNCFLEVGSHGFSIKDTIVKAKGSNNDAIRVDYSAGPCLHLHLECKCESSKVRETTMELTSGSKNKISFVLYMESDMPLDILGAYCVLLSSASGFLLGLMALIITPHIPWLLRFRESTRDLFCF